MYLFFRECNRLELLKDGLLSGQVTIIIIYNNNQFDTIVCGCIKITKRGKKHFFFQFNCFEN